MASSAGNPPGVVEASGMNSGQSTALQLHLANSRLRGRRLNAAPQGGRRQTNADDLSSVDQQIIADFERHCDLRDTVDRLHRQTALRLLVQVPLKVTGRRRLCTRLMCGAPGNRTRSSRTGCSLQLVNVTREPVEPTRYWDSTSGSEVATAGTTLARVVGRTINRRTSSGNSRGKTSAEGARAGVM